MKLNLSREQKFIVYFLLELLLAVPAWAFRGDLQWENTSVLTHVNAQDWTYLQDSQAQLTLRLPLGKSAGLEAKGAAAWGITQENPVLSTLLPNPSATADLVTFVLWGEQNTSSGAWFWKFGRWNVQDLTHWLVNTPLNSVQVGWAGGSTTVSVSALYTGWLNRWWSNIFVSQADYQDLVNFFYQHNPIVFQYTAPRIGGSLTIRQAQIFQQQTLEFELFGQVDSRSVNPVNTAYATLELTGPWTTSFSSKVFFSLTGANTEFGTFSNWTNWAGLAGANLSYQASPQLTLKAQSLWPVGFTPSFGPLALSPQSPSATLPLLSLMYTGNVSLSLESRPQPHTFLGFKTALLFQAGDANQNSVSTPFFTPTLQNLNPTHGAGYLGTEFQVTAVWNPTSEWRLKGEYSVLSPADGAFTDNHLMSLLGVNLELEM